jgi:hypothetical protein
VVSMAARLLKPLQSYRSRLKKVAQRQTKSAWLGLNYVVFLRMSKTSAV